MNVVMVDSDSDFSDDDTLEIIRSRQTTSSSNSCRPISEHLLNI